MRAALRQSLRITVVCRNEYRRNYGFHLTAENAFHFRGDIIASQVIAKLTENRRIWKPWM